MGQKESSNNDRKGKHLIMDHETGKRTPEHPETAGKDVDNR